MSRTLSQTEKDQIRYKITTNTFSAAEEIAKLVEKGYDAEEAKALLLDEIREYKQELFNRKMKQNKQGDTIGLVVGAVAMLSLIGPIFGIRSPLWYVIAFIGAGVGGYFAAKDKPIAGVVAGITFGIVFPLAYNMYFTGRTVFIKIEMLVPMIMAGIPAFLLYFILSKTVYANSDNESLDY